MSKKIHRFITPYIIDNNTIHITDDALIHQWKNVLKLKNGEDVILVDNEHGEALSTLSEITNDNASFLVKKITKPDTHSKKITLYMAILKNENFELVIQKASEIGIHSIVPIITARTVKTGLKHERLQKISKEASELSGRIDIPQIQEPITFTEALTDSMHYPNRIVFDASGQKFNPLHTETGAIFVGPEGGFSEEEIALARESGCTIASLGQFILRGETAGIIASYLACNS